MDNPKDQGDSIFHLHQEINRLFRDLLAEEGFLENVEFPVVDILETGDSLRIEVEIPGLDKDDIKIEISGDTLIMEGAKRDSEKVDRLNYICMERRFGYFRRAIMLPAIGDTSNIKAFHEKGLLIITLPKISDRRGGAKKIEIE